MKKVLFATTALIATAGVASADIAMSGSAEFGSASEAGGDSIIYSNAKIVFTMSGVTDGGLEFGTSMDASAGNADYDPGDFQVDDPETGAFGLGAIYVAMNGMKLSVDNGDIDNLYDDDFASHDMQFDYAQGPLSFSVTYGNVGADDAEYSYTASVTQMGFTATITGDEGDDNVTTSVEYAMAPFTFGVEVDSSGADETATTVSASYEEGDLSLSGETTTQDGEDDSWTFGVGYTVDALTLGLNIENDDDKNEATAAYALGGGANVIGGVKGDDSYYIGMNFKF